MSPASSPAPARRPPAVRQFSLTTQLLLTVILAAAVLVVGVRLMPVQSLEPQTMQVVVTAAPGDERGAWAAISRREDVYTVFVLATDAQAPGHEERLAEWTRILDSANRQDEYMPVRASMERRRLRFVPFGAQRPAVTAWVGKLGARVVVDSGGSDLPPEQVEWMVRQVLAQRGRSLPFLRVERIIGATPEPGVQQALAGTSYGALQGNWTVSPAGQGVEVEIDDHHRAFLDEAGSAGADQQHFVVTEVLEDNTTLAPGGAAG